MDWQEKFEPTAGPSSAPSTSDPSQELEEAREILRQSKEEMQDPEKLDIAANHLFQDMFDNVLLGLALEAYFDTETRFFEAVEGETDETNYILPSAAGQDVFPEVPIDKMHYSYNCPCCDGKINSARFAPHLEKCMGLGRTSARASSRRAGTSRENTDAEDNEPPEEQTPTKRTRSRNRQRRSRR